MATTYTRIHHYAVREKLLIAQFVVGAAWTKDVTDYWTIQLFHLKPTATYGKQLGATYSLATHDLTANRPVTIYTNPQGLDLDEGDVLYAKYTKYASAADLTDPTMRFQFQKMTR